MLCAAQRDTLRCDGRYGLRKLAEKHLIKMLNGLIVHRENSLTVFNCAKFTLLVGTEVSASLDVYLDMVATMLALPGGGLAPVNDPGATALTQKMGEDHSWVRHAAPVVWVMLI